MVRRTGGRVAHGDDLQEVRLRRGPLGLDGAVEHREGGAVAPRRDVDLGLVLQDRSHARVVRRVGGGNRTCEGRRVAASVFNGGGERGSQVVGNRVAIQKRDAVRSAPGGGGPSGLSEGREESRGRAVRRQEPPLGKPVGGRFLLFGVCKARRLDDPGVEVPVGKAVLEAVRRGFREARAIPDVQGRDGGGHASGHFSQHAEQVAGPGSLLTGLVAGQGVVERYVGDFVGEEGLQFRLHSQRRKESSGEEDRPVAEGKRIGDARAKHPHRERSGPPRHHRVGLYGQQSALKVVLHLQVRPEAVRVGNEALVAVRERAEPLAVVVVPVEGSVGTGLFLEMAGPGLLPKARVEAAHVPAHPRHVDRLLRRRRGRSPRCAEQCGDENCNSAVGHGSKEIGAKAQVRKRTWRHVGPFRSSGSPACAPAAVAQSPVSTPVISNRAPPVRPSITDRVQPWDSTIVSAMLRPSPVPSSSDE